MKSNWNNNKAKKLINDYKSKGINKDLALRIYTSQLLGKNSEMVLHGGGNTSVKSTIKNLKNNQDVIFVKGSGKDMANIDSDGFAALEINNLNKLKKYSKIDDYSMINFQRKFMVDTTNLNPSVETLLHAFLPYKYVDHTHSNAILSLIDQPKPEKICNKVFGKKLAIVPYIMPGFDLAKLASNIYKKSPDVEGLILLYHGIFTFGNTAKESYDRMIKYISIAENELRKNSKKIQIQKYRENKISASSLSNIIRKNISNDLKDNYEKRIVYFYKPKFLDELFSHPNINNFSNQGPVTPDHVIRIKSKPLIIDLNKIDENKIPKYLNKEISKYKLNYIKYFKNNSHINKSAKMLDPYPRLIIVKGLGIFSTGKNFNDAKIAMDVGLNSMKVKLNAAKYGVFKSISEKEIFRMEYWPLELSKLKKSSKKLAGNITVVTGGAGVLGYATAKRFLNEGSEVILLDIKDKKNIDCDVKDMTYYKCDVTKENEVAQVFKKISEKFGGVDILVSNAGIAIHSSLEKLSRKDLNKSFDINLFGHHNFIKQGIKIMKIQNTGGAVLLNISKQSVNPAPNFGAYGMPKATLFYLMKQYAVENGEYGIRFNGINADRIKSKLLNDKLINLRAKSRGVSKEKYMMGNLLNVEVKPEDVADAFYFLAISKKTTACVLTVDGGKVEASLR